MPYARRSVLVDFGQPSDLHRFYLLQYTESDRVRTLYEKYIELDSESDRVRTLYEKYIKLDSEFDRVRTLYEKYIELDPQTLTASEHSMRIQPHHPQRVSSMPNWKHNPRTTAVDPPHSLHL
ncbi:hypothetical protein H4582DRAFT_2083937 [Lactarius indigo]|nr:hypothetical protein H4582DRAFT_2083937 [Lactarius indigo]